MCALIGYRRGPAGQRHCSARTSSSQCLRHRVRYIMRRATSSSRAAGSRPECRTGKPAAPPRHSTLSARLANGTNHAEPSLWAWRASSASGWSWQAALVRIKSVEEAALATPHRTWPWPLMAARPHPIRPRPARPKATVHAPPGATFDVDCYRNSRQQAQLLKQQVKNKTTKRPTPTSCRNSLSHRYDGTRPESTGLSAGTEQRRVQPVSQTTKRPTTTFCRPSR